MKTPEIKTLLSLFDDIRFGQFHYHTYTSKIQGKERLFHCFVIYEGDFNEYHIIVLPPFGKTDPFTKLHSHKDVISAKASQRDIELFNLRVYALVDILRLREAPISSLDKPGKGNDTFTIVIGEPAYNIAYQLENEQKGKGGIDCDDLYHLKPYKSLFGLKQQYENRLNCRIDLDKQAWQNPDDFDKDRCEIDLIDAYVKEVTGDMEGRNRIEVNGAKKFLGWLQVRKAQLEANPSGKEQENKVETSSTNSAPGETDVLQITIEKYFEPLKTAFRNDTDYNKAFQVIYNYFKDGKKEVKQDFFVKQGNTKKLAKSLGGIFRNVKNETITYDFLHFSKQLFSIFKSQKLEKSNIARSTFYKYFVGSR